MKDRGFKRLPENKYGTAYIIMDKSVIGVALINNGALDIPGQEFDIDPRAFDEREAKRFYLDMIYLFGQKKVDETQIKKYDIEVKDLKHIITPKQDRIHRKRFEEQAVYLGNSIYHIAELYSTNPRELKLMFTAQQEGIDFKHKEE